jgi:hypothetical protein
MLVSLLGNPRLEIEASKWATRGWTYQEALLSRRRLVFTRSQVYFQCQEVHCWESVKFPLFMFTEPKFYYSDSTMARSRAFPMGNYARSSLDYSTVISEYCLRSLSFESDILNAVYGVLKMFDHGDNPLYHIWGMPIEHRERYHANPEYPNRSPHHCRKLALSLLWKNKAPAQRRHGFSSWSWVGWSKLRGLDMRIRDDYWISDVQISLELRHGTLIPWVFDTKEMPVEYQNTQILSNMSTYAPFLLKYVYNLHRVGWFGSWSNLFWLMELFILQRYIAVKKK